MHKNFNLFRLNCMMDDTKSKNFNSIIVSLTCELLYENENKAVSRNDCYKYIVNDFSIALEQDLYYSLLENSRSFQFSTLENDVFISLTSEKYSEIHSKVMKHSIEFHIDRFVRKNGFDAEIRSSIEELLFQSLYENINSFTSTNIKSILPENLKNSKKSVEIQAFNDFLDDKDHEKNVALFNVFLKAVEFALLTSGKGVKQFTKDIFEGKEYLLDSNIIFRLLGVGGEERRESLRSLIQSCQHQGIKFHVSIETINEVRRKIDASISDIRRGTENSSIEILEELVREKEVEFNFSFVVHYAQSKINGSVRSPEQYEMKLQADFRALRSEMNISELVRDLKQNHVEHWQELLYAKKKELNKYTRYTKMASKVDATNILLVRKLRGSNNYNYSDIKSFYLTTDRSLNNILAKEDPNLIAESILPSQLYILHSALSDSGEEKDYEAFNKFLKRRTTEFKYEGREVLTYINEIRNYTADTISIKDIIKAYADKKYKNGLGHSESEPDYKSISEFAKTYLDKSLEKAQYGNDQYQDSLLYAKGKLEVTFSTAKKIVRVADVVLSIGLIPLVVIFAKTFTSNLSIIIMFTIVLEALKFFISSKTKLLSNLVKIIYNFMVVRSSFNKATQNSNEEYNKFAQDLVPSEISIWR